MQISNFHNVVACRYLSCNFKNVYPFSVLVFLFFIVFQVIPPKKSSWENYALPCPFPILIPTPHHLPFLSFQSNSSILFELYEQKMVTTLKKHRQRRRNVGTIFLLCSSNDQFRF